jgi:hypothetical protein
MFATTLSFLLALILTALPTIAFSQDAVLTAIKGNKQVTYSSEEKPETIGAIEFMLRSANNISQVNETTDVKNMAKGDRIEILYDQPKDLVTMAGGKNQTIAVKAAWFRLNNPESQLRTGIGPFHLQTVDGTILEVSGLCDGSWKGYQNMPLVREMTATEYIDHARAQ